MNRITSVLMMLLLTFFYSCQDDSWKDEIADLRQELSLQAELIAQLQQGILIKSLEQTETGYQINFSNGESIELQDGSTPIITIGENGNWFVNGNDTDVYSVGTDGANGEDGTTPEISIGENGNWWIDGVDTGKTSTGESGSDAPSIVSIVKTGETYIFYFSDSSSITIQSEEKLLVLAWGDSLTAGAGGSGTTYPKVLQELLGDRYLVVNAGVGGENSKGIAARQGGIPMLLLNDVVLPADETAVVLGELSASGLVSSWDNSNVKPLLQGGSSSINNCTIDGIECVLKWTGSKYNDTDGRYTLQRVSPGAEVTLNKNSVVYTSSMKNYRDAHINIFFIGQNGGWTSPSDLVAQYKAMVDFSNSNNYLVLGLSSGTESSRAELEAAMTKEFGARYVNLRQYLSSHGLSDAGLVPTSEDITAIDSGSCPKSLLYDSVHLNSTGYQLIGNLLYDRIVLLGVTQ